MSHRCWHGGPTNGVHLNIQDRDGGVLLMSSLFGLFPFLLKLGCIRAGGGKKETSLGRMPRPGSLGSAGALPMVVATAVAREVGRSSQKEVPAGWHDPIC